MMLSFAIVVFYLFFDGLLICKYMYELFWKEVNVVPDTQATVKACGPLVLIKSTFSDLGSAYIFLILLLKCFLTVL